MVAGDFPTFIQNKCRWGGQCGSLKRGLPYGLSGDPYAGIERTCLAAWCCPLEVPSSARFPGPRAEWALPPPSCSPSLLLCWARSQGGGALDAVNTN